MFASICGYIPADPAFPPRTQRLDILRRVLDGTLYDVLPYEFQDERNGAGEYVPLRNRRPSVRYPLARIVVDDSLSLVFSEGRFPTIDCADEHTRGALADIVAESALNRVMMEAALRGSVGSVAVLMRVLRGRVFFSVLDSLYLTPVWDPQAPDTLLRVTERYKVTGAVLQAQGYEIADPQADYWFARSWDGEQETWYLPAHVADSGPPAIDTARTTRHGMGFVPIVWIRNLPGGDAIDGASTFASAIDANIEIDYQLSQAGRGLKYSSDPTLLIREPVNGDGELVRGGGNALVVSEKGDARLLEIDGTASAAVIDYVRTLREFALEGVHGNRAGADRIAAPQSGRALELMNQGLLFLADNLRVSYGDAVLQLARMVVRASTRFALTAFGQKVAPMNPALRLSLIWPRWYAPDAAERQADAATLSTLVGQRLLSTETAVKSIADVYDIPNVAAELRRIERTE